MTFDRLESDRVSGLSPSTGLDAATASGCLHQRGHVLDSIFHGGGYATAASRRIFCDRCRLQRWLYIEGILAASQGELGMIPTEAAMEIRRACQPGRIDLDALGAEFQRTGHSLVALLRGLQAACKGTGGEFVHYGATTQDIQDTAQALEMREVLNEAERDLVMTVRRLVELAVTHRDTLMVGRTHAQPALPITFGLKVASWIDELLRQGERLGQARVRVLVVELFGGAGTMAGFDGRGRELLEQFAARLGLAAPAVGWHTARDRVAEFTVVLAMLTATLARIADEVRVLSRPELGEVAEDWEYGRVGSSTMPHKRNAERSAQVVVLAKLARANAMLGMESMLQEHERDARGLRIEWVAVADVAHHALAALAILREVLQGLRVYADQMAAHAYAAAEAICSEALMLALGRRMGKQSAHALVYDLSQRAQSDGQPLRALLLARAEVASWLGAAELDQLLDPARYVGDAGDIVDRSVRRAQHWLVGRQPGAVDLPHSSAPKCTL
ncbi:MAG: adenylosuccinate lyase family protein [Pseudonocardiaceae bacterium]